MRRCREALVEWREFFEDRVSKEAERHDPLFFGNFETNGRMSRQAIIMTLANFLRGA